MARVARNNGIIAIYDFWDVERIKGLFRKVGVSLKDCIGFDVWGLGGRNLLGRWWLLLMKRMCGKRLPVSTIYIFRKPDKGIYLRMILFI
jgi:hypothetical protein